jgi:DNA-binding CsgD family transcriptional regulator
MDGVSAPIIQGASESDPRVWESSPPSHFDRRAESRRLRFEFLRNTIDLSLTIAGFAAVRPQSRSLKSMSLLIAQKGYQAALTMWEKTDKDTANIAELNPKMAELRRALGDLGAAQARPVAARPNVRNGTRLLPVRELLTVRELEVLQSIASGYSTKETAHRLGMSFKTAACHRYRLMEKLAIHDTASLVRYAIREGLVQA